MNIQRIERMAEVLLTLRDNIRIQERRELMEKIKQDNERVQDDLEENLILQMGIK